MNEIKVWKDNDFSKLFASFTVNLSPDSTPNDTTDSAKSPTTNPLPSGATISLSPPVSKL